MKDEQADTAVECDLKISKLCEYGCGQRASAPECNYMVKTGQRRGCSADACTKFKRKSDTSVQDNFRATW